MLPEDQVEHAHDNPLDEITLGECDETEAMMLDEIPAGRKTNIEPGVKSEGENDPQMEAETTKKQGKKEKSKGERHANPKTLF